MNPLPTTTPAGHRRPRRRLVAATSALLAGLLAACGGSSEQNTQEDPVDAGGNQAGAELLIWADTKRATVLEPFAAEFGEANGVNVEVATISEDLQTTFVTAASAGEGPDVLVGAHDWIGNLVQNGTIDPIQFSEQQRAQYNELAIEAMTFNDQFYGVPYAVENLALIRNTALAPDAPATIEDLVATGQQLVKEGSASEILALQVGQNGDPYHVYPLLTSAGGYLFGTKANGDYDPADVGIAEPGSIAAFEKIRALGEQGAGALKRSIGGENSISVFTGQKAAFLVSGPWAVTDIAQTDIDYDISPIPPFADGGPARPFVGVQAFFVASGGDNKALAQELVTNYLSSEDVAIAMYEAEPRPPALKSAAEQLAGTDQDLAKFLEAGSNGDIMPAIPEMAAIWDPLGKAEAQIVGGAEVAPTLTAAADAIISQIG